MNNKIYAFVFARGGSKGIPKKNLIKISGIPLLGHSINIAKEIEGVNKIFVSTDCDEIANVGKSFGAEIIKRPYYLSQDDSPEWSAWQHAVKEVNERYGLFDIFLSLPTTSPLRSKSDILKCIEASVDPNFQSVITISELSRNPWFNMVTSKEGKVELINKTQSIYRRQDAPKTFGITTVAYVLKPGFILSSKSIWEGNVKGVEIPTERSIDIDNFLDYKIAKYLFEEKINGTGI